MSRLDERQVDRRAARARDLSRAASARGGAAPWCAAGPWARAGTGLGRRDRPRPLGGQQLGWLGAVVGRAALGASGSGFLPLMAPRGSAEGVRDLLSHRLAAPGDLRRQLAGGDTEGRARERASMMRPSTTISGGPGCSPTICASAASSSAAPGLRFSRRAPLAAAASLKAAAHECGGHARDSGLSSSGAADRWGDGSGAGRRRDRRARG